MNNQAGLKKLVPFNKYVQLALSHAVFTEDKHGAWTVEIPILPGCVTWGETREEAVEMALDAVEGWVLTALRFGDEIPVIDGCALHYTSDLAARKAA